MGKFKTNVLFQEDPKPINELLEENIKAFLEDKQLTIPLSELKKITDIASFRKRKTKKQIRIIDKETQRLINNSKNRERYKIDPEKHKKLNKEYYLKNKDRIKATYQENKESLLQKSKERYYSKKEEILIKQKEYQQRNKDKLNERRRNRRLELKNKKV